jgi:hypothetical protein
MTKHKQHRPAELRKMMDGLAEMEPGEPESQAP